MSLSAALICALVLVILLFAAAMIIEAQSDWLRRKQGLRQTAYLLALGVYCSSWTFYGAVGSAARDGWSYLPIYLAPVLLLLFAPAFLRRLSQAVAEEQAVTISDFIAARFGHDVVVARLVTLIALVGTIPYVALQFRSIGSAMSIVSGQDVAVPAMLAAAVLFATFAIAFGARRFELAGRSEGLVFAIGMESAIKLLTLLIVGGAAIILLTGVPAERLAVGLVGMATVFDPSGLSFDLVIIGLISAMAIIVLPRQFYMGLVEAKGTDAFIRARFGFAAYLGLMALIVLPITLAGMTLLPASPSADLYVLQVPTVGGMRWVVIAALLGGISAAASMVIVDAIALAAMVSNDLIFPTIIRNQAEKGLLDQVGRRMLLVRRISIVAIIVGALAWALLMSPRESLASIGLVAFAAMAQFTPHLILATQARGRDPMPARASLIVGFILWFYTLAAPEVIPDHWLSALAGTAIDPLRLLGIGHASPIVHGVMWSLGTNLMVFALATARTAPRRPMPRLFRAQRQISTMPELIQLTASFVGDDRAHSEFAEVVRGAPVDRAAATQAQRLIAGVVGASSARALVASALAGGQMDIADVTRLLDRGGQSLRFSRQLLASTFENIDAGISVVDAEMNLVAWNSRYVELFGYPDGMVQVGTPVAELIRYNGHRGDFGSGNVDHHIAKRLSHMRRGQVHSFERRRSDGRVLKTVGGPMPGGGYVMSFTDISAEAHAREELRHTLDQLEQRVADRTQALSEANRRLAGATRDKTRFLAAASHDLLQPLHAARLFTAALEREVDGPAQSLVQRVDRSIVAAEDLLRALLDISRLDAGGVQPVPEPTDLAPFLTNLVESIRPIAAAKGLRLRAVALRGSVRTDPGLLRSVIQNFLVNAVRYSDRGGVVVGVRQRGPEWRIDVVDSGVGIAPDQHEAIFREFARLGEVEVEGFGLGLALCERIVKLLGGRIELASRQRRGSRFSLYLPIEAVSANQSSAPLPVATLSAGPVPSLTLLVIDNDPHILEASVALLTAMGHRVRAANGHADALASIAGVDAVLADYQLDNGEDGITLINAIRQRAPTMPAALVTAENGDDMRLSAAAGSITILSKPASVLMFEGFLAEVAACRSMGEVEAE